jgi:hypothetical protein
MQKHIVDILSHKEGKFSRLVEWMSNKQLSLSYRQIYSGGEESNNKDSRRRHLPTPTVFRLHPEKKYDYGNT